MSRKAKKRLFAGAWMILALICLFGLVLTHAPRDVIAELYNVWTRPLILNTTGNDTSLIMSDSLIVKSSIRTTGGIRSTLGASGASSFTGNWLLENNGWAYSELMSTAATGGGYYFGDATATARAGMTWYGTSHGSGEQLLLRTGGAEVLCLKGNDAALGTQTPTSAASVNRFLEIEDGTSAGLTLHDSSVYPWDIYGDGGYLYAKYNNTSYMAFNPGVRVVFTDTVVAEKGIRIGTSSWTLPVADGSADQVLTTNGSGSVTWEDAGGGGGGSAYKLTAEDGTPDSSVAVDNTGNVLIRRPDGVDDGDYILTVKNEDVTYNECAGMKIQAGRNGKYALYIIGGNGSTHYMDVGKYGGYVGIMAANAGSAALEVAGVVRGKWRLEATDGGSLKMLGAVPGDIYLNSGSFGGQNWWYFQGGTQIMRIDDPADNIAMYNPSDKDFVKQWSVYNGSTYSGVNAGDGSWSTSSSRTMKEDIREVNYRYLLPDGPVYALNHFEEPLQFAAKDSNEVKEILKEKRVILSPLPDSNRVSMLKELKKLKVRSFKWNLEACFPEADSVSYVSHQDTLTHEAVYDTTVIRFRDKAKEKRAKDPKSQEAKTHLGLVAEEFYPIAKAMGYEGDSTMVNWGYVRMAMLMAIQEQDDEIAVLRGRVSTLEELHIKLLGKVDSLALVIEGR